MSKYNRLLDKQKGYMYNNRTFSGYKYDILGGCPKNNNQLEISTTMTTISNIKYPMDTSTTTGTTTTTTPTTTLYTSNTTTTWDIFRTKSVINLSSTPLTAAQETLLARGSNFVTVPKYFPRKVTLLLWGRHPWT